MNYMIEEHSHGGGYESFPTHFTGYYQKKNWFGKLVWKQIYYTRCNHTYGRSYNVYNFSTKEDVMRELIKLVPYKIKTIETGIL
jgi:hypothetical protein